LIKGEKKCALTPSLERKRIQKRGIREGLRGGLFVKTKISRVKTHPAPRRGKKGVDGWSESRYRKAEKRAKRKISRKKKKEGRNPQKRFFAREANQWKGMKGDNIEKQASGDSEVGEKGEIPPPKKTRRLRQESGGPCRKKKRANMVQNQGKSSPP